MAHQTEAELIVHIGLPKTGTTAIQNYMFANREILLAKKVYWAETYPLGLQPVNDWAHHVYSHKWGGWLDVSEFRVTPDEAWQALGDIIRRQGGRYLVSSERFADVLPCPETGRNMLKFIVDAVAPARVKLIGYVRRQDNLVESHIRELIEGGQFQGLDWYFSDIPIFVNFDKCFITAADVLGRENVMVRVYDPRLLSGGDSVTDFLKTCEIPLVVEPRVKQTNMNVSLNALAAKLLSDPRLVQAFSASPVKRGQILDYLSHQSLRIHRWHALLGPRVRSELMDRCKAGNERLAEIFLSETEAKALHYDEADAPPAFTDEQLVMTYGQLVELLLTATTNWL